MQGGDNNFVLRIVLEKVNPYLFEKTNIPDIPGVFVQLL